MKFSELKVYIASPFFNSSQLKMVDKIETTLDQYGVSYFSPRSEGVIKEMSPYEKEKHLFSIYESNISNMENANLMIAVIDDYDTGTVFELGYFTKLKYSGRKYIEKERKIITITGSNYDLNVMLKFGVDCHLKNPNNLANLIKGMKTYGPKTEVLDHWDSKPEVRT